MIRLYRALTALLQPVMPVWLHYRRSKGKEDEKRLNERLGHASLPRPTGTLIWIHAASVGEASSVLPLLQTLRNAYPANAVLLTTGTVTSARLMETRLPEGVLHQFSPLDTPGAVQRFMAHWRPQMGLFVESELWPNLILCAHTYGCRLVLVNARMSERSYAVWRRLAGFARTLLQCFTACLAQSEGDAERLRLLGTPNVSVMGNLKYDAAPLPSAPQTLAALQTIIDNRPVWLAASTHPGEEAIIAAAHRAIKPQIPGLLTIIVPRHPARGAAIAAELRDLQVARRTMGDSIKATTDIYLADTLGELGLFYRVCPLAFIGGSLVPHGGQNPLEAARLGCAILLGPHMRNFAEMDAAMVHAGIARHVTEANLAAQLGALLRAPDEMKALGFQAKSWVEKQGGATAKLMEALQPLLQEIITHAA